MPEAQTLIENTLDDADKRTAETAGAPNPDGDDSDPNLYRDRPQRVHFSGDWKYTPSRREPENQAKLSDNLNLNRGPEISEVNQPSAAAGSEVSGGTPIDLRVKDWRHRVENAWNKTLEDMVQIGKLLKDAKEDLGVSYKQLEQELPFSASMAGNFIRIAEHKVLSDAQYFERLPNAVSTLSYLARIKKDKLIKYINQGAVTPELPLAKAKELAEAKTRTGARSNVQSSEHMDVVVSIPRTEDVAQAVKAVQDLAKVYSGMLDYRRCQWPPELTQ